MSEERFELMEKLGAGGMGAVWKARDNAAGSVVAIKFMHPLVAGDPEHIRHFQNEVDSGRRIDSPHVVRVHGYGRREGDPFMVMEFVQGKSLAALLTERGRLTWDEARPIALAVARALQAAHSAGVTHRDVKPSNILVGDDGSVKLADFGIARADDFTQLTQGPIGTLAYMSPDVRSSARSDLYSLGCVIFEMLVGRPPFTGTTVTAMMKAHAFQKPPVHLVTPPARSLVAGLLAKRPERRPADAAAVAATLEAPAVVKPGITAAFDAATIVRQRAAQAPLWSRVAGPLAFFVLVLYHAGAF